MLNWEFGQNGSETINDTTQAFPGPYVCIDILQDAQFHTYTDTLNTDRTIAPNKRADAVAGNCMIYPAGTRLFGNITNIRLHNGTIIAYKR